MMYEGIVDKFNIILPNAGILPFNSASELDEIYQCGLPFETYGLLWYFDRLFSRCDV